MRPLSDEPSVSVNPPKPRVDAYTVSGPLRVAAPNAALARTPARTQRAPTVELESAVRMHSTVRLRSCRLYPRERTQRLALHRATSLCRLYRRMRHQSLPGHPASNILRMPSHLPRLGRLASIHRLTSHRPLPNLCCGSARPPGRIGPDVSVRCCTTREVRRPPIERVYAKRIALGVGPRAMRTTPFLGRATGPSRDEISLISPLSSEHPSPSPRRLL